MVIVALIIVGLCLGSFVNAMVWRLHEQSKPRPAKSKKHQPVSGHDLSIISGRSMCPHCKHSLAARNLVPVLSWLYLKGKCRYCNKPIAWQYPLVELLTAGLFVASYTWWPVPFSGSEVTVFILWLGLLVGLVALFIYDLRWMLLPNRLVYPLGVVAVLQAIITVTASGRPLVVLLNALGALIIGGGLFYTLFQLSSGKWIGGGDVKLGWLLGLIVATPARSILVIFLAAVMGSLVSLPLLAGGRLGRTSTIPFGPFLIVAAIIVRLFGANILDWYQHAVLMIG